MEKVSFARDDVRRFPSGGLYAIYDVHVLGESQVEAFVDAVARGGATVAQLRAKHIEGRELVALAMLMRRATRTAGIAFVINDRPDIAVLSEADGLHLGQDDVSPADARRVVGDSMHIALSTHDERELAAALSEPIDAVAFGPVFATSSKQDPDPEVGVALLAGVVKRCPKPVIAIGGITHENVREVASAKAAFVAVISSLSRAPDWETAARRFATELAHPHE